jgi:hypothetical protein
MEPAPHSQFPPSRRLFSSPALFVLLALAAGLTLRLWMLGKFFQVNGDSLIYGGLAKNLLLHDRYALNGTGGELYPTLIRLPGYPLFLALCFRLFGMENYVAACWAQIALELAGCLLLADFARRIAPPALRAGAAQATLWLAALCPFTAVYAANPLTEAPTLFALAVALWSAERFRSRPAWSFALAFTFAVSYAALLRPDGALVAVALAPALIWSLRPASGKPTLFRTKTGCPTLAASLFLRLGWDRTNPGQSLREEQKTARPAAKHLARMALVCALLALAPFALWSARNYKAFQVFEPLAPRLATDPGEDPHPGWERWTKSWCLDFVSTYNVYWSVPGGPLDLSQLPDRAFDSPAQRAETAALADDYNQNQDLTHEIDLRFGKLADEREAAHPLRSRLWLPLGRMADMWLRPRVENLPIDLDWWVYEHHNDETRFSWAYAGLNAVYLLLGLAGLCLRPRWAAAMLTYFVLRSALLTTIEAPEARYTIECFPMLFVLGGIGLWAGVRRLGLVAGRLSYKRP